MRPQLSPPASVYHLRLRALLRVSTRAVAWPLPGQRFGGAGGCQCHPVCHAWHLTMTPRRPLPQWPRRCPPGMVQNCHVAGCFSVGHPDWGLLTQGDACWRLSAGQPGSGAHSWERNGSPTLCSRRSRGIDAACQPASTACCVAAAAREVTLSICRPLCCVWKVRVVRC